MTYTAIGPKSWKPEMKYMPCKILDYDCDNRFIIARKIAVKECWREKDYMTSKKTGQTYYWIIDTSVQQVHGPFKKDQFEYQRKLLGVTADL